jgi:hypothetical protein
MRSAAGDTDGTTGRFTNVVHSEREVTGAIRWGAVNASGATRAAARPSGAALFGTCLWVVGLIVAGTVLGMAVLVALAKGAPAWYRPSALVTSGIGYLATLGGLCAVRVTWLRWRLLGVATGAVVLASLLTAVAL